jgi:hypothetical protein
MDTDSPPGAALTLVDGSAPEPELETLSPVRQPLAADADDAAEPG